jgi:hypothetical protein
VYVCISVYVCICICVQFSEWTMRIFTCTCAYIQGTHACSFLSCVRVSLNVMATRLIVYSHIYEKSTLVNKTFHCRIHTHTQRLYLYTSACLPTYFNYAHIDTHMYTHTQPLYLYTCTCLPTYFNYAHIDTHMYTHTQPLYLYTCTCLPTYFNYAHIDTHTNSS